MLSREWCEVSGSFLFLLLVVLCLHQRRKMLGTVFAARPRTLTVCDKNLWCSWSELCSFEVTEQLRVKGASARSGLYGRLEARVAGN